MEDDVKPPAVIPPLQFDTALVPGLPPGTGAPVTCAFCRKELAEQYYDVSGQTACVACREQLNGELQASIGWGVTGRAVLCGIAAAIAGAALYYAVIAITDFEIGLVAIAIGFMVGYAVRFGASGRGGRRFQAVAVLLTYWAVGLAYTPLVFPEVLQMASGAESPAAATGNVDSPDNAGTAVASDDSNPIGAIGLLGFTVTLPIIVILGSLPGGLLTAAIIAFGMHQAWRMTAAAHVEISGPYRIGSAPVAHG